jgi:hypothetical protein
MKHMAARQPADTVTMYKALLADGAYLIHTLKDNWRDGFGRLTSPINNHTVIGVSDDQWCL